MIPAKLNWKLNRVIPANYAETEFGVYMTYPTQGGWDVLLNSKLLAMASDSEEAKSKAKADYQSRCKS